MLEYMLKDKRTNTDVFFQRLVDYDSASDGQKTDYIFFDKLDQTKFKKNVGILHRYCKSTFARFCHLFGVQLNGYQIYGQNYFDSIEDIKSIHLSMFFNIIDRDIVNDALDYQTYIDNCMDLGVSQYFNTEVIATMLIVPFVDTLVASSSFSLNNIKEDRDTVILDYINNSGILRELCPSLALTSLVTNEGVGNFDNLTHIPISILQSILTEPNFERNLLSWYIQNQIKLKYTFGGNIIVDNDKLEITFQMMEV